MDKTYIFGNWIINVIQFDEKEKREPGQTTEPFWIGANYQADAPECKEEIGPDWGVSGEGKTVKDAAIDCITSVWGNPDGMLDKAVQLASAMIALRLIPLNIKIENLAAIIDGCWFFGTADKQHGGIQMWNELCEIHEISEYGFSLEGESLAREIQEIAKQEYDDFERAYSTWESSWIDGPQG